MVATSSPSTFAPRLSTTHTLAVGTRISGLLAIATGGLYFSGFAGGDLWPCAFIALTPLAVALQGRSARACLRLGMLAGFTMNALGMYWLHGALQSFSGLPAWLCWVLSAVACVYQAGRIGLFSWLYARARDRGWPDGLVFLLAFVASELLYPTLLPWYFAASVHQLPPLTQLAELGGPYLVGLVLAAANLAVAEVCLCRLQRRSMRPRFAALCALAPVLAMLWGGLRMQQIDASLRSAEPGRAALIQANLPLRRSRRENLEALRRHLQPSRELQLAGVDFAVWSESALRELAGAASLELHLRGRSRIPALIGALVSDTDGSWSNAVFSTDAQGRVVGRYDKQRLLPFAESVPLLDSLSPLSRWLRVRGRLEPGTSLEPLAVAHHRVTVLICYEDLLPAFVNRAVNQGRPELLVNLTNDGWFGDTTAPWIHLALAQFRAIEHRRYLLRSTNSGVSAVIDPVGRVIVHGRTFERQLLQAEFHWMRDSRTLYELVGDAPWWAASALIVALAFYPRTRRRGDRRRPPS